ncbi:MAG: secreted glycosyl hydrolase [Flavobacteriaceae bacterium]|nr:secreted glycosyl hydrolase [Flavobacteriaceae bacterium]
MRYKELFIFIQLFFAINLSSQEIQLFNSKNIDGWNVHGTEKGYVEDGNLVCESGPDKEYGYLSTSDYYKDFELSLDFKQEADGNSGVFFRSTVDGTVISGWQVEVAPPGNATGGIYESYGRGWLIKPEIEKDKALIMGEWNNMKIKVNRDSVITWLNGVKMIELIDKKIGSANGSIVLQIHDGGGIKVRWKNIILKQL